MKTNNITKKSFLMTMVLALTAGFNAMKNGGTSSPGLANGYVGGGSPIYIPRRTRFKGYMRENRRYRTNKTK
jgi:hypothetical protein